MEQIVLASKVPVDEKNNDKSNDESSIPMFSQWKADAGWQDTPHSDAG